MLRLPYWSDAMAIWEEIFAAEQGAHITNTAELEALTLRIGQRVRPADAQVRAALATLMARELLLQTGAIVVDPAVLRTAIDNQRRSPGGLEVADPDRVQDGSTGEAAQ